MLTWVILTTTPSGVPLTWAAEFVEKGSLRRFGEDRSEFAGDSRLGTTCTMRMVAVEVQSCEIWVSRRVLPAREPTPKSSANISDSRPFPPRYHTRWAMYFAAPNVSTVPHYANAAYLSIISTGW